MGKFNSAAHITHEYGDNGSLIDASFHLEPSSKLTCTSDIPLDPANAIPPTVTTLPGDVEGDEVVPLVGVARILEFSGKKTSEPSSDRCAARYHYRSGSLCMSLI